MYEEKVNTVIFMDGQNILDTRNVKYSEEMKKIPQAPKHFGRRFIGWYVSGSRDTVVEHPADYPMEEDTIFEAAYKLDREEGESRAYLFAYFTDNNEGEKLFYGVSRDGYTFRQLNQGRPVFTSTLGTRHLRDPYVFRGEDGYYYITATDLHGTGTPNSTILMYKSADLISICGSLLFDYKQFPNFRDTKRAWAPQAIWCPCHVNEDGTRGAYMVYLAMMKESDAAAVGTVMYHQFTTDLMDPSKYTEPEMMLEGQENGLYRESGAIDGDIIYDPVNKRYLMFFDGGAIARCDTVDGVYREIGTRSFDRTLRVEGSNIYKLLHQDKWIIMADGNAFGCGFQAAETTDFNTFTRLTEKTDCNLDFIPRHGYVIPISEEQLQILFDEYGEAELPETAADEASEGNYRLLSYTTDGSEYMPGKWPIIGGSLHLAVSKDGGASYEPLNSGIGVLFAEADYGEANPVNGSPKMMRDPCVFRRKDGGFGVIAARADETSDIDATDGRAMIYTSEDLTEFDFQGYLSLDHCAVSKVKCEYGEGVYKISWTNAEGRRREGATTDFRSVSQAKDSDDLYAPPMHNLPNAQGTNSLTISRSEYESLRAGLNAPENTGVKEFEPIMAKAGEDILLPKTAAAVYSDGSTADYPVEWDVSGLDTSKAGEYILTGAIRAKEYPSDMIADRADPCIIKRNGMYYFAATRDSGGQTVLNLRAADSIEGIAAARDHEIFAGDGGLIWAPEIHDVDGRLLILFAAGPKWNKVQSHVMIFNGGNPLNKNDWSAPVRVRKQSGEYLIENGITLDMTCFCYHGIWYYAWAQRVIEDAEYGMGSSDIHIASFHPADPTVLTSEDAVIARPVYGWERSAAAVNEGPFTIEHNGSLYMTIAVNGCNSSYGIKMISLREGGNPLCPSDWMAKGYPLLATAWNLSEPGPGHSSFTTDENGDDVLIYHWGRAGKGRTTSAKRVHWNGAGEPVLNIPHGQEITSDFRTVKIKVIITY